MRRKVLVGALLALLLIGALSAYVALTAGRELFLARRILSVPPGDAGAGQVREARTHLRNALEDLRGVPARILRLVPIARQNVDAVEAVTEALEPVLEDGAVLSQAVDSMEGDIIQDGSVRLGVLGKLGAPLSEQEDSLATLRSEVQRHRSGWLLPPVWDEFDRLLARSDELHDGAETALDLLRLARPLLGSDEPRTYLVILVNNAELRGAGGVLTGVGTLRAENGSLELGEFFYTGDLRDTRPYRRVPAPADFKRRFGPYAADSTLWINTTFSPDVPDVAIVASRLFRLTAGIETDGAIVADPRGIAALMPPGQRVSVPGTTKKLATGEFSEYVYWHAYEQLGGPTPGRREVLFALGKAAFETTINEGFGGPQAMEHVADAVAGGHLRFVSFNPKERAVLSRALATGDMRPPEGDTVFVTTQNFGEDKLDFWARRKVEHRCDVGDVVARCATTVTISNEVRRGLSSYIAGSPYGLNQSFLDVYVPSRARLTRVELDGKRTEFFRQQEEGHTAVELLLKIPRGDRTEVTVGYDLPLTDDGYVLRATPQPLSHDAALELRLSAPSGWSITGPGRVEAGTLRYSGPFDRALSYEAQPEDRAGLAALWGGLVRFWREPVF